MSLFEHFDSEKTFCNDFIKPLLNRIGFFLVTEYHGRREFGKDFVFSELHRFGGMRHYAAQVKHDKKISLGKNIDDIMTDVHQAFSNPFTLPDLKEDSYISAFYLFNSGNITEEAKDDLINRLKKTNYGQNVYLLTGERLDSLSQWSTYQADQNIRMTLLGLKNQLILNIKVWSSIKDDAQKESFSEARGSILFGIESYMSCPIFTEMLFSDIADIWQFARIIDKICSRHLLIHAKDEFKKNEAKTVIDLVDKAITSSNNVILNIDKLIEKLKPL